MKCITKQRNCYLNDNNGLLPHLAVPQDGAVAMDSTTAMYVCNLRPELNTFILGLSKCHMKHKQTVNTTQTQAEIKQKCKTRPNTHDKQAATNTG